MASEHLFQALQLDADQRSPRYSSQHQEQLLEHLRPGVLNAHLETLQTAKAVEDEVPGQNFLNPERATNTLIQDFSHYQNIPKKAQEFQSHALAYDVYRRSPFESSKRQKELLDMYGKNYSMAFHLASPFYSSRAHDVLDVWGDLEPSYSQHNGFEQAFDAVDQIISEQSEHTQEWVSEDVQVASIGLVPGNSIPELARQRFENSSEQETPPENTRKEGQGNNDADKLARTAGEILHNLKDDENPKFKNSNFLSLMRQLRDREVHVEGDKIVETPHSLHPGGQFYPHGSIPKEEEDNDTAMTGAISG